MMQTINGTKILIPNKARLASKIQAYGPVDIKYAVFDWDGTVSRLREGWQNLMLGIFMGVLCQSGIKPEDMNATMETCMESIDALTGKPTYSQMVDLAQRVAAHGAQSMPALNYKRAYITLLDRQVLNRLELLHQGRAQLADFLVPGSKDFLKLLYEKGIQIYVATGSDEAPVINELKELGIMQYCVAVKGCHDKKPGDDPKFTVIKNLIQETNAKKGELFTCGDGFVEVELGAQNGFAIGVNTKDDNYFKMNQDKAEKLTNAGADVLVDNFVDYEVLAEFIMNPAKYI
ncbi:HAD hydrolase-like protein [candidate division KSB1 bacterium]|nr:HAD hydrolase-like protein [candidate division KSB1 bacterium]